MRFRRGERQGGRGERKRERRGKERRGICTIKFRKPGLTASVVAYRLDLNALHLHFELQFLYTDSCME